MKNEMKKKPPDVIHVYRKKENPLLKWIELANWAFKNHSEYLYKRAIEKIVEISSNPLQESWDDFVKTKF